MSAKPFHPSLLRNLKIRTKLLIVLVLVAAASAGIYAPPFAR
jgi:hypothetical protein